MKQLLKEAKSFVQSHLKLRLEPALSRKPDNILTYHLTISCPSLLYQCESLGIIVYVFAL